MEQERLQVIENYLWRGEYPAGTEKKDTPNFSRCRNTTSLKEEFFTIGIQIMFNKERNHWIATHYQNGKVKVYDSCFYGSLSPSIHEMLVHLYQSAVQDGNLVVTVMPIVQQRGSDDCGPFAFGTAFQAASGLSCDLRQEELRQHLKVNFDNGILTTHNFWEERHNKS